MTIENSVSNDIWSTFVDSINVFDCRLPGVHMQLQKDEYSLHIDLLYGTALNTVQGHENETLFYKVQDFFNHNIINQTDFDWC